MVLLAGVASKAGKPTVLWGHSVVLQGAPRVVQLTVQT